MGPQGSWALVHRTTCTTCMAATGAGLRRRRAWVQIADATLSGNIVLGKLYTPTVPLFT